MSNISLIYVYYIMMTPIHVLVPIVLKGTTPDGILRITVRSVICRGEVGGNSCHPLLFLINAMGAKVGIRQHVCTFVQTTSWFWIPTKWRPTTKSRINVGNVSHALRYVPPRQLKWEVMQTLYLSEAVLCRCWAPKTLCGPANLGMGS